MVQYQHEIHILIREFNCDSEYSTLWMWSRILNYH